MYETVLNYICLIGIVVAVIAYSILKDKWKNIYYK